MTDEERLAAYMQAFNASDYDALRDFYRPDVRLVIGSGKELVGPQAIIDFYREVKSRTRRTISILQAFSNGETVAAELRRYFDAGATELLITQTQLAGETARRRTWRLLGELAAG